MTAIAEATRRVGARAIVAVGGGRVLDAGKAAAALLEHDGVRLVTVPTVPGCGAELSRHTSLHVHAKPLSRRAVETVHGELGGVNDAVHVQESGPQLKALDGTVYDEDGDKENGIEPDEKIKEEEMAPAGHGAHPEEQIDGEKRAAAQVERVDGR